MGNHAVHVFTSLGLILALSSGCATHTTDPKLTKAKPIDEAPQPVLTRVGERTPAPSWFMSPCPEGGCPPLPWQRFKVSGADEHRAVMRLATGQFVVSGHRTGVQGPLQTPGVMLWLKPASSGRLLGADERGQLWAAASSEDALRKGGWTRVAPSVRGYLGDVRGDRVVVVDRDRVYIGRWSAGSALSLAETIPKRRVAPKLALIRSDETVVVSLNRGKAPPLTMIRYPKAARWTVSPYQPPGLRRRGDVIYASWSDGADCPVGLSGDPRRWTQAKFDLGAQHWKSLMTTTSKPRGERKSGFARPSMEAPEVPKATDEVRGTLRCKATRGGSGGMTDLLSMMRRCRGWDCLRGTRTRRMRRSTTQAGFFADGVCKSQNTCGPGELFVRPPSVAVGDGETGRFEVVRLPPGCDRPQRLEHVRGLLVLACGEQEAGSRLYTAVPWRVGQAPLRWAFEGRMQGVVPQRARLTVGGDGTLLWAPSCPKRGACVAWVRRPVESGTPAAWRVESQSGVIAWRVGVGGELLGVREDDTLRFFHTRDGEAVDVRYQGPVPRAVEVTEDGVVTLTFEKGKKTLWSDGAARL